MGKKRTSKMGRPPVKDKRNKVFTVRFKQSEFKQLVKDAKEAGITPTELLRQCWQESR